MEVVGDGMGSAVAAGDAAARTRFVLARESQRLSALMSAPRERERCEMVSGRAGFSSIAAIDYVARRDPVEELLVMTFNVSKARMLALERLHAAGMVGEGHIVASDVKAGRDPCCRATCARMGWRFDELKNHAKLILMRTEGGARHCVRTSSNLNENPRIETYSWGNDPDMFAFYARLFDAIAAMRA